MNTIEFFRTHAGLCIHPGESEEQARDRGARNLAAAEGIAHAAGVSFQWEIDPEVTSADWCDDEPAHAAWCVVMRDCEGGIVGSLGGVDFGADGEPWSDPYRRVVEAELCVEYVETTLQAA